MTLTRAKLEQLTEALIERTTRAGPEGHRGREGLGASDIDEIVLVGGQTRMPAVQEIVKKLFGGKEPHKGVNPDEVVAIGAAIQAGVLKGEVKDVLLLDVTPLSLGVETKGGVMTALIPRNTTIPTRKSEIFSTAEDNQSQVEIHVLQGERPLAARTRASAGSSSTASRRRRAARRRSRSPSTSTRTASSTSRPRTRRPARSSASSSSPSSGLSEAEIQRMVREAEQHASEDARRREEVELRNRADNLAYAAEKLLRESGDQLPSELKLELDDEAQAVRRALDQNDVAALRTAIGALERAMGAPTERPSPRAGRCGCRRGGGGGDARRRYARRQSSGKM